MNPDTEMTICLGSSCFSRGNKEMLGIVKSFLHDHNLESHVFFHGELCTGHCDEGPILKINDLVFKGVSTDNIYDILNDYFTTEENS